MALAQAPALHGGKFSPEFRTNERFGGFRFLRSGLQIFLLFDYCVAPASVAFRASRARGMLFASSRESRSGGRWLSKRGA